MDIELLTLEELKNISDYMVAKRRGEISESWESIVELLGLDMSKDNFRKASIGADIERRIHELEKANNSTDEEIERLNEKINEYKIERYKWLDVKIEVRQEWMLYWNLLIIYQRRKIENIHSKLLSMIMMLMN